MTLVFLFSSRILGSGDIRCAILGLPTYQRCAPGIEQPKKCAAGGPGSPKLLSEQTSLRSHRGSGKAKQLAGDLVKCFRFFWVRHLRLSVMRCKVLHGATFWGSPAKMSIHTRFRSRLEFFRGSLTAHSRRHCLLYLDNRGEGDDPRATIWGSEIYSPTRWAWIEEQHSVHNQWVMLLQPW